MAEKEYIEREAYINHLEELSKLLELDLNNPFEDGVRIGIERAIMEADNFSAADVRPVPDGGIGEMSDGYHTFNGLYYQRMVLFAALVKAHKDKAWKSWRHEDGELCFGGGWFIVGIDTPEGSYTYHYEDKDWDRFECEELPVAKHWDGHTEEDVTRLLSLDVRPVKWTLCEEKQPPQGRYLCVKQLYNENSCKVVFHAQKITPLIKCGECIHRYDLKRQMCTGRKPDFFCADGEKKTKGTEFFTERHLHLGNFEEK